jgi:hypothetical protein
MQLELLTKNVKPGAKAGDQEAYLKSRDGMAIPFQFSKDKDLAAETEQVIDNVLNAHDEQEDHKLYARNWKLYKKMEKILEDLNHECDSSMKKGLIQVIAPFR